MTLLLTASVTTPVRPGTTEVYLLDYDRPPKAVEGDLALIGFAREDGSSGVAVVTSSAFRLTEARRTDRAMHGPFASVDEAFAAFTG
jgi:hypothetical protein